ncbi:MAG: RNB domain-containing ribonuclease [Desulfobacteraceae bacterium]|nr:RNB domain-containing ribonuclease [Desulfobacteraceae bacterium]MBC2756000.1 RNB domain-containing ribonuclease [Desulfobacteraceae bacterium]
MEHGIIVEYIDQQQIFCAVVVEHNDQRVRLLNENNREVSQKISRLSHISRIRLKMNGGRDKLIASLKETAVRRKSLSENIDIRELWEVLSPMAEWVDLPTMTGLCFPGNSNGDHEAAIIRACFDNRIYFKFNHDSFFPHSEQEVEKNIIREKEKELRNQLIEDGGDWLKKVLDGIETDLAEDKVSLIEILKSYYLFGKESPHSAVGRAIISRAGVESAEKIFDAMVKIGAWKSNYNIDLKRYDIPETFSDAVLKKADAIPEDFDVKLLAPNRRNLTSLPVMTIDGQGTLDFDDAISIEAEGGYYRVGVHIADVCEYVARDDVIDQEVINRGTSIYMPDMKIPMMPPKLSENICSLKVGEVRPAISTFFKVSRYAELFEFEVVPTIIKVGRQLTYNEVDLMVDTDESIWLLNEIACNFRRKRLSNGAVQISIPETSIRVFDDGDVSVRQLDRESPGRMFVSEMMIMANWLMARFLADNNMPAIFRGQPEPKARLYSQKKEGTLFQNWMQRRMLNRAIISSQPESHSGLGLDKYVTATSPIRKYFDLVTQRQIRACFDMEPPYSVDEIENMLQFLKQPLMNAGLVQIRRNRYWLLKYLEKHIGAKEEAIVLNKVRDKYIILLTTYLVECKLGSSSHWNLKPQDLVRVTISHVDARRDVLNVDLG